MFALARFANGIFVREDGDEDGDFG